MKSNKLIKNILFHVKYPYTAAIIAIMWVSMAIIIINQNLNNLEILLSITSLCTIIISLIGFKSPK